jgi:hypothetical protein
MEIGAPRRLKARLISLVTYGAIENENQLAEISFLSKPLSLVCG